MQINKDLQVIAILRSCGTEENVS